ncbi:hypothetical protein BDA96_10G056200 [Sorghum bicolor]|uniref:DUF569 domain-containing protein n=2 Tax=Sorghum bicolor TaxID=4558 RepID=A0A921Q173_SORBI|nr:uncharacterized protein LOC8071360 [Sorghum bicolor]KAG0512918.1 hypothetical protein BDA96_10G056200 [Sorghum bicolor]KXG19356.2 hypothetical protein SORBI_3010G048000 [Sorghum bicolor]|eukprot:XP_021304884.1 uncharacterized protein LOC8071360 [Sorghum bicolor]
MDRFPDGTHVWLRNRVRRTYLYADEDGSGVSLSARRETLNAAWQVHLIVRHGLAFILLRSAAYGRYLGPSPPVAQPDGHRGRIAVSAVQRDYSEPLQANIRWRAKAVTAGGGGGDYVLLYQWRDAELYLRANGRYRRWNTGVTVAPVHGHDGDESTMMHWTVEHIPPRPAPPTLPAPTTDLGGRTGLLQRRTGPMMDQERQIRYFLAGNNGKFLRMGAFRFVGRSVLNLTNQMANKVGEDMSAILLCVYAGVFGRLTPLVVDLPRSQEPLNIIVLPISSPAAVRLLHPNVDAPEHGPAPASASAPAPASASAPAPAP